jgi:hypothetical protein
MPSSQHNGNSLKSQLKVRFISPANIELDEAIRYYDHQLPGPGFRYFQCFNGFKADPAELKDILYNRLIYW